MPRSGGSTSVYSQAACGVRFGQVELKMPVKHPSRQRKFKARPSLEIDRRELPAEWVPKPGDGCSRVGMRSRCQAFKSPEPKRSPCGGGKPEGPCCQEEVAGVAQARRPFVPSKVGGQAE